MDDDVTAGYVISEGEHLRSAMLRITDALREIIEKETEPTSEMPKRSSKVTNTLSHNKRVEF